MDEPDGQRWCSACKKFEALELFAADASRRDGLQRSCTPSRVARNLHARRSDPEAARAQWRAEYAANPDARKAIQKRLRERGRAEVFAAYGGRCACCGENDPCFLTVEHKTGVPDHHRTSGGNRKTGVSLYAAIKREGFPADYELRCFNCNLAKAIYGECPHRSRVQEVIAVG